MNAPHVARWLDSLVAGIAIVIVLVYALVRRWILDKAARDEAEFVEQMGRHFVESEPPEAPPGTGA